ncbi:carbon monoxide dehydrogenase subunit G [Streptomyces cinnamoneus]|uniref:Carbon monoxide dehydrogenase subunit G n=1 Tax=Streptomyces cinnamoneus TaxID=53446 RepID=A0A2G1XHU0_STRCJ|nr:SRPBCC domain-containing protein [Streptomyces cinnamoneus]PHQ50800.1 carbon monoxide dehydrogenase subunit G [Streptomyces cinnamoneus]PPT13942.1 carbon monoxide dehydrogenase subunit G [Streptomyces cinnamoneus]
MEHEVFVPFPVGAVRRVLSDPARVARCVPGLQQDASAGTTLTGRLRLRIGGSTITYRGALRLTERDGVYELSGEGTEARGSGTVTIALSALPEEMPGGTRLSCTGTVGGAGRLAEFDAKTAESAARRLLDRFAAALAEELREDEVRLPSLDAPAPGEPADPEDPDDMGPEDSDDSEDGLDGDALDDEPPAEAAHARRTMIGRSAEEVDHAPPRGRYAPVPAPETTSGTAVLRWAAPAAALALAGAVVVTRVLRRKH